MEYLAGNKEYFKGIGKIKYEGKDSHNPLSYKWYDENKIVAGKEHERIFPFCCCILAQLLRGRRRSFWTGHKKLFMERSSDPIERAKDKMDAAFEFITKMGIPFYCFHDFDLVDEGDSIAESDKRVQAIVDYAKEKQKASGVKLLWGTSNVFSNPRYMNGAATNPDFNVITYAGTQVKRAIDATIELGGDNYVFWGGREGYLPFLIPI